jgi:phage terminase large subunit GpA-like protein
MSTFQILVFSIPSVIFVDIDSPAVLYAARRKREQEMATALDMKDAAMTLAAVYAGVQVVKAGIDIYKNGL